MRINFARYVSLRTQSASIIQNHIVRNFRRLLETILIMQMLFSICYPQLGLVFTEKRHHLHREPLFLVCIRCGVFLSLKTMATGYLLKEQFALITRIAS